MGVGKDTHVGGMDQEINMGVVGICELRLCAD